MAAKVPTVPGALGDKPEPKPNAKPWIGLANKLAQVGLFVAVKMLIPLIV